VAPFLIAPRAGALADRIGERPLIVSGLLRGQGQRLNGRARLVPERRQTVETGRGRVESS
jgi:hypothetical protein